eukprot:scaffold20782_cov55-Cyclotella_meneghiniana.AAC.10
MILTVFAITLNVSGRSQRRLKHSIDSVPPGTSPEPFKRRWDPIQPIYCDNAATTMDKNGEYTTINLMLDYQIAAAIADDGIREYPVASGWREGDLEAAADVLFGRGHSGLFFGCFQR